MGSKIILREQSDHPIGLSVWMGCDGEGVFPNSYLSLKSFLEQEKSELFGMRHSVFHGLRSPGFLSPRIPSCPGLN